MLVRQLSHIARLCGCPHVPQTLRPNLQRQWCRPLQTSFPRRLDEEPPGPPKQLVVHGSFEDLQDKSKTTYLDMIRIFGSKDHVYRRGHVEFVYSALKNMESFGVHKDLEVYKALIDVMPKGRFIARNQFQVSFMHYPKQQQCMIDLLEQMEDNGVMPDYEMQDMLTNVFGKYAFPLRKFWRMMYWMPKFKNLSPWPLPDKLPDTTLELAKLAVAQITGIDVQSQLTIYQSADIQDAIEDTWIVSGQSPTQKRLLQEHDPKLPVYVEGGARVWLRRTPVNYFVLRTNPKPFVSEPEDFDDVSDIKVPFLNFKIPRKKQLKVIPSVHEQEDGVVMAVCATGTSSKDSLLSWIRHLERDGNPAIARFQIVFTLRSTGKEVVEVGSENADVKRIEQN